MNMLFDIYYLKEVDKQSKILIQLFTTTKIANFVRNFDDLSEKKYDLLKSILIKLTKTFKTNELTTKTKQ